MYPMFARHAQHDDLVCYSFLFRSKQVEPKFLTRTAKLLGCLPELHFEKLMAGESVTLKDGTFIDPSMVHGSRPKAHGFLSINLPSAEYLPSFLEENRDFVERLADESNRADSSQSIEIVHSSLGTDSMFTDKRYLKSVVQKLSSAKHFLDCAESNSVENNKLQSVVFANHVHQLSPSLVSVGQPIRSNANREKQEQL